MIKNNKGCKGCAKLVQIVNTDAKFCTTEEGVLYIVDDKFYLNNKNCDKKVNYITLKGQEWK